MPGCNFRQFQRPLRSEQRFAESPNLTKVKGHASQRYTQTSVTEYRLPTLRCESTRRPQTQPPPTPCNTGYQDFGGRCNSVVKNPSTSLSNLPLDCTTFRSELSSSRSNKGSNNPIRHCTTFNPRINPPPNSAKTLRYTFTDDEDSSEIGQSPASTSRLLCSKSALHKRMVSNDRLYKRSQFAIQSIDGISSGEINWILSPCIRQIIDKKGTSSQQGPYSREFSVTCAAPVNWLRMKLGGKQRRGYSAVSGESFSMSDDELRCSLRY